MSISNQQTRADAIAAILTIQDFEPSAADYILRRMEECGIGVFNVRTEAVEKRAAPLSANMMTALRRRGVM